MNRYLPFALALALIIPASARAGNAATTASTTAATPPATSPAIEKFGAAAKKYESLQTLRVRWHERSAVGRESIWELRLRKLTPDNFQLWVRGYDPTDHLTNTFVYDGKRYLHLRTDENVLESEILSPAKGSEKVLTASPTVFLCWAPLLAGVNFAADKAKVTSAKIENGRVVLKAQLPGTQGPTRLEYGFDAADLLKSFSLARTINGFDAELRWTVQKQEPNVALTDADFVLKAPPKPPTPKLSLKIDPRALQSFARAARFYGGLKSWSATVQSSINGGKRTPTQIDLVKPGQLRILGGDDIALTHYVRAGQHWIVDPLDKTYQQTTSDVKGAAPAATVLSTAGALPREVGAWMVGQNALSATVAPQFYEGAISVEAKRLADARLRGENCERVSVTERDPADGPLGATTERRVFWLNAKNGALLRVESRIEEKGEDVVNSIDDFSQRFNGSVPASRFVFVAPKGFEKQK